MGPLSSILMADQDSVKVIDHIDKSRMTLKEKEIYHQIHPFKLAVDIGSTPVSLYLFWQHELILAVIVTFVPSIIASAIVMKYASLERYRSSSLGHYVKSYMTRTMEGVRSIGLLVMMIGAWSHIWQLMPVGLLVILFSWSNGIVKRALSSG